MDPRVRRGDGETARSLNLEFSGAFASVAAVDELELDRLIFLQGLQAGGLHGRDMNENVLSAIVGFPDLMLIGLPEDSPLQKPLLSVRKAGEEAAAIVQDLLLKLLSQKFDSFCKPSAGKGALQKHPCKDKGFNVFKQVIAKQVELKIFFKPQCLPDSGMNK